MAGGGILALLAGGKSKGMPMAGGEPDDDDMTSPGKGPEDSYAREAFSAIKDGDEDGFVSAFIAAVKACAKSYGGEGEPDGDEG